MVGGGGGGGGGGTNLEDEPVLDVEQDLARVAIVLNEYVERVGAVDPAEKTRVGRERDDGVLDDRQVALERLWVDREERVDEPKELHDALVLPKILVACEERRQREFASEVTTRDGPFSRKL